MSQKQNVPINFAQGLDLKTDPWQVEAGKFLLLQNSVFTKGGLLQKRNGYSSITSLPDQTTTYLTTFNGNLTAVGSTLEAFSQGSNLWINKGTIQPLTLSVMPTVRSAFNQTQCDSVLAPNGNVCVVYTEVNNSTPSYKYEIQDSVTGQNLIAPTLIPAGSGVVTGSPRVFLLGGYFIIVFTNVISTVSHLQYIAVSQTNPSIVSAAADIASAYISATTLSWDGYTVGNKLFVAYNTTTGGQKVSITYLTPSFIVATPQTFSGSKATMMSVTADQTNPSAPIIYASFYDSVSTNGFVVAVDQNLNKRMTATQIITTQTVANISSAAQNGILTAVYEVVNAYAYDSGIPTDFINTVSVTLPNTVTTGTVGSTTLVSRSVGLASKSFLMNGVQYILTAYQSNLQSTYFMMDLSGRVISRFAYENGGGYLPVGLPQAQVVGAAVYIAYLYKDLIQSTNTSGLVQSIGPAGASNIYAQTGINISKQEFTASTLSSSEIGSNLNLSGGFMWAFDGQTLNEQGYHLFPDNIETTWSTTGGAIHAQPDGATNTNAYYHQVTYEWTDIQGNIFRSAPSIPIPTTTTGSGTTGSITLHIPTLRLTYKTGVKIVVYRWSVANPIYYQVTSLTAPTLNDKTVDAITYVDALADSSIIGNNIIYTTGGVLENIGYPASVATTLFDNRLWSIRAEDRNILDSTKQVIEGVPVEYSDLLSLYVAPSTGAQGSTGPLQCLFPMDDKLILSKADALYYINGSGPDNTGANSQYSQPIFITATVGSSNQKSFVLIPGGVMFQSDKGIWLLGRDLQTTYIGAPVEEFNSYTVNSAVNVPGTNQVRFMLSNGVTLMYDYFYGQWGTFVGVPSVSSTLYQSLHTFVNSSGQVYQESPGSYLDGSNPVLLKLRTSWFNLAGLQGYQRAFFFYLLGQYYSPHKLYVEIAYDYNPSSLHSVLISPTNYSPPYGGNGSDIESPYGNQITYGGPSAVEQWRVFMKKQRCQSFQLTISEIYDPTLGASAGAGLTLSGINLIIAAKRGWIPISSRASVGAS